MTAEVEIKLLGGFRAARGGESVETSAWRLRKGRELVKILALELLTLRASVDVDELEDAARHARRAGTAGAYRAALSLYRGELLPENRYDDWALPRAPQASARTPRC